jgi:uncharacterized protein (TIGR02265 family)
VVAVAFEEDWEAELARRLARSLSMDTVRGLLVQSLLEELRALGDEALHARALALCGPGPLVELFHYPVRTYLEVLGLLMPSLVARHGGAGAGLRALGRQGMVRFLSSHTGRLLLKLSGQDPQRMLNHTPMGYRVVSGASQHVLEWRGPRHCHWRMHNHFMPVPYHEGLLLELLARGGARDARVVGRQTTLADSEYDISWSESREAP